MSNIPVVLGPTCPVYMYPRNKVASQHGWYLTRYYVTQMVSKLTTFTFCWDLCDIF